MRVSTIRRGFIVTAGVLLFITGLAKIWSGLGQARILFVPDPLIGIELGHLLFLVGVAEVVIALCCFFSGHQPLVIGLLTWLSTNFVVYRLGLLWIGWQRPCSCLGNLTDAIHVPPHVADGVMKAVLVYLLVGSYGSLFHLWQQKRRRALSSVSSEGAVAPAA